MISTGHMRRRLLVLAVLGLLCPATAGAHPSADEPKGGAGRRPMRDPQRIQQRLDRLLDTGVSEDDPRVQRLRRMLEVVNEQSRSPKGPLSERRRRMGGPRHHSPEEIRQFVEQHAVLHPLLSTQPDGSPAPAERYERNLRRFGRQISEIMVAVEEGREQLSKLLIQNAQLHFSIAHKIRAYHQAPPDAPVRQQLHDELADLVRQQVAIDLAIEEQQLQSLRERLQAQEERLHKDRERQEEIAARKLQRILSRKHGRGRGAHGPGRRGAGGPSDEH